MVKERDETANNCGCGARADTHTPLTRLRLLHLRS